LVLFCNCIYL